MTTDSYDDLEDDFNYESDVTKPRHPSGVIAEIVESMHPVPTDGNHGDSQTANEKVSERVQWQESTCIFNELFTHTALH